MADSGTPIRTSHANPGSSVALLHKYLADQERITSAPVCACPARKKLACSGEGFIPGICPLDSLSKK
jgi:hypothetical protein